MVGSCRTHEICTGFHFPAVGYCSSRALIRCHHHSRYLHHSESAVVILQLQAPCVQVELQRLQALLVSAD